MIAQVGVTGSIPQFISAATQFSAPDTIAVTFDQAVTGGTGFLITTDDPTAINVTGATPSAAMLILQLDRITVGTEIITLDYTPGNVKGLIGGLPLGVVSGASVTNNSP